MPPPLHARRLDAEEAAQAEGLIAVQKVILGDLFRVVSLPRVLAKAEEPHAPPHRLEALDLPHRIAERKHLGPEGLPHGVQAELLVDVGELLEEVHEVRALEGVEHCEGEGVEGLRVDKPRRVEHLGADDPARAQHDPVGGHGAFLDDIHGFVGRPDLAHRLEGGVRLPLEQQRHLHDEVLGHVAEHLHIDDPRVVHEQGDLPFERGRHVLQQGVVVARDAV
mmetsp:Transcript_13324/g.42261  ORF Transcript_13324/g.42261 Transcript_13324/m.42261 type:complete len:222 (-) Transcript_13324:1683-2348(-)